MTTWLDTLYKFDENHRLRMFRVGWDSNGKYHTESGNVFNEHGQLAKHKFHQKWIPPKTTSETLVQAARRHAKKEWLSSQRNNFYHPYHQIPLCTETEWLEMWKEDRHWPAIGKQWELDLDEDALVQRCDDKNPFLSQYIIPGIRLTAWIRDGEVHICDRKCSEVNEYDVLKPQLATLLAFVNFAMSGSDKLQERYWFGLDGIYVDHDDLETIDFGTFCWIDIMDYGEPGEEGGYIREPMIMQQRYELMNKVHELLKASPGIKMEGVPDIVIMPHQMLRSIDEIYDYREQGRSEGFHDGLILRRPHYTYTPYMEYRNNTMYKFKYGEDDLFVVRGFKEEPPNHILWDLQDRYRENVRFNCPQMGTEEYQKAILQKADGYVDRLVKVRFMHRFADFYPYQCRVLRFDLDEELPIHVDGYW